MSNLDAIRTELRRTAERPAIGGLRRLGPYAAVALLILAVVAGLSEIHILPSFSADDVGSILFGAG